MTLSNVFRHLHYLARVAMEDAKVIAVTDQQYGASWKKRGGVGVFMMLARKWDRLEERVQQVHHDIFQAAVQDDRAEGLMDDIRDLRRYLLLVECELRASVNAIRLTKRDEEALKQFEDGWLFEPESLRLQERWRFEPGSLQLQDTQSGVSKLYEGDPADAALIPRKGDRRKGATLHHFHGYGPEKRQLNDRRKNR